MNGVKQKRLVKSIAKLAARCCSYLGDRCDCKYIHDETAESSIMTRSETGSGCPELTMATHLIAAMTEQEFNVITKRAGISISSDSEKQIDAAEILKAEKKIRDEAFRCAVPPSKKTKPKNKVEVWKKDKKPYDLTDSKKAMQEMMPHIKK